uniref:RING-CH-type domain-containing protein n=1 Tax=Parastrongyloides trichosuri TaxID=131310 RepID=A0A0N4Z948_PARTI
MTSSVIEYTANTYNEEEYYTSDSKFRNEAIKRENLRKLSLPEYSITSTTNITQNKRICRICFDGSPKEMISPCRCRGSCQFVHNDCLTKWYESSGRGSCEICKYEFLISRLGFKPLTQMTMPKPFSDEMEDVIDFYCALMWFTFLLSLIAQSFSIGVKNTFYMVCLLKGHPIGIALTIIGMFINMIYYTEVLLEVYDKWYIENSIFQWANYVERKENLSRKELH